MYGRFWQHFAGVGVTIFFTVAVAALLLSFAGAAGLVIASVISLTGSIVLTGALVTAVSDDRSLGGTEGGTDRPVSRTRMGTGRATRTPSPCVLTRTHPYCEKDS
jgi:hypothetical protein